jgi:hypothetical protein
MKFRNWLKEKEKEKKVPDAVKNSQFGCINCLQYDVECKKGSMYIPKGKNGCKNYIYFD